MDRKERVRARDLGEFGLIDRLDAIVRHPPNPRLILGIGDDAAAWEPEPDTITVATTDCLIEGVHFDLATTSWTDLGWKAMAENLSDVAAMGCRPRYALIGMALPGDRPTEDAEALYRGVAECGAEYECVIVGGDTVASPIVSLHVTVVGESEPVQGGSPLLRRSSAQPGDSIAVTGPLGGSAAGLRLLKQGARPEARGVGGTRSHELGGEPKGPAPTGTIRASRLVEAHLRPRPRVAAGLALVEAGVRCSIDISDGLLADLEHICERSSVGAEIDLPRIPIHPDAVAEFGAEAESLALNGGEDYELIAVGSGARVAAASNLLARQGQSPLTVIGTIIASADQRGMVRIRNAKGQVMKVDGVGYQHFVAPR